MSNYKISITNTNKIILELLGNSLLNNNYSQQFLDACSLNNWQEVFIEAVVHNVETLILQSILNLPQDIQPDKNVVDKWRNSTIFRVLFNEYLMSEQNNVLKCLKEASIDSVILKGTSVSCFYPAPKFRALGDIDILINKNQCEAAIDVLCKNGYVFDHKHDFHTVVKKDRVIVELHNEVTSFPDNDVGRLLSSELKNVFIRSQQYKVNQISFPAPSPFDNALILLLHMQRHLNKGIGLRQLCDWIMFVNCNSQPELWNELLPFLDKTGLKKFAAVLTKMGVLFLGLDSRKCTWCLEVDNKTCYMFLREIFNSGNMGRKRSLEDSVSVYLTDGYEKADRITYSKMDRIKRIFMNLGKSAKRDFPFLKKCPVLLPIMFLYIPLRYFIRMIIGKRPRLDVGKLLKEVRRKNNLYKELKIFQTYS